MGGVYPRRGGVPSPLQKEKAKTSAERFVLGLRRTARWVCDVACKVSGCERQASILLQFGAVNGGGGGGGALHPVVVVVVAIANL